MLGSFNEYKHQLVAFIILTSIVFSFTACSGGAAATESSLAPGTNSVQVSWAANRESAVNKAGGGYRVYYSTLSGFNVSSANFVNVPYVSGAFAPVSVVLSNLAAGTYYIKVVAYSVLNPPGGSSGSSSAPSEQISLTIP